MRSIPARPARRPPRPGPLVLAAALLAGCHNNYQMPSAPARPVNKPNARLVIRLQMPPAPPRQMDPTAFSVRLSDAHGQPVNGARVTASLVMPTMDMGGNSVVAHPQGAGVYVGSGRFSMGGDWDVVVQATAGTQTAVQTFPVRVR